MVTVRVEDAAGTLLGRLTEAYEVGYSVARSAPGALSVTYPAGGRDAAALNLDDAYLVVDAPWGPEVYLLDDDDDDEADEAGDWRQVSVTCRGLMAELGRGRVYPTEHVAGQSLRGYRLGGHVFVDQTPGAMLGTLISRAKLRGAIPRLTVGFTNAADSNGVPWPTVYSRQFDTGQDLLAAAGDLVAAGWMELRMVGNQLNAYLPAAVDRPRAIVRTGRGAQQGPRRRSRSAVRTVLVSVGDDGLATETVDQAAVARYGRREGYEGRSGITNPDVLDDMSQQSLAGLGEASETFTVAYLDGQGPAPGADFLVGNTIRWDERRLTSTTLEPLRVQSIALGQSGDGPLVVSLELADKWVEDDIARQLRIDAQTLGSTTIAGLPKIAPGVDVVAPETPTGVTLTPTIAFNAPAYQAGEPRDAQAAGVIGWNAVTRNEDGTAYDDAGTYYVSVLIPRSDGTAQWTADELVTGAGPTTWSGLPWSAVIQARVRAQDRNGNSSSWGYSPAVAMLAAYSAPGTASTPTLAATFGQISVTWDGKTSAGATPVAPVTGVQVHTSTAGATFTPTAATLADFLPGANTTVLSPRSYAVPTYVRLVLVDYLGQAGPPSTAASITPPQVGPGSIVGGAVGSAKLADLSVTTAKIANGAVNDGFIVSMSAGKIVSSTLTTTLLLSGYLRTAASGNRFEVNADGVLAYNASNQVTNAIRTDGSASFAGVFKAIDLTGQFRVRTPGLTRSLLLRATGGSPLSGGAAGIAIPSGLSQEYSPASIYEWLPPYDNTRFSAAQRPFGFSITTPTVRGPKTGAIGGQTTGYQTVAMHMNNTRQFNNAGAQPQVQFVLGAPTQEYAPGGTRIWLTDSGGADDSTPGVHFYGGGSGDNVVPAFGTDPIPEVAQSLVLLRAVSTEVWVLAAAGQTTNPSTSAASVRAAGFPGTSARRYKEAITEPTVDPVDVVLGNPSLLWTYRGDDRQRIGPMADDLPVQLSTGDAVDQASAAGLLWALFADLDRQLVAAGR